MVGCNIDSNEIGLVIGFGCGLRICSESDDRVTYDYIYIGASFAPVFHLVIQFLPYCQDSHSNACKSLCIRL